MKGLSLNNCIYMMLVHPDYWNKRYKDAILESSASSANSSTIETDLPAGLVKSNDNAELGTYDWFRTWEHLETWFKKHLTTEPKQPRILHLGCGNSVRSTSSTAIQGLNSYIHRPWLRTFTSLASMIKRTLTSPR